MLKIRTVYPIDEFREILGLDQVGIVPECFLDDFKNVDEICSIQRRTLDAQILSTIAINSPGDILEIGTSYGHGTYQLSLNAKMV